MNHRCTRKSKIWPKHSLDLWLTRNNDFSRLASSFSYSRHCRMRLTVLPECAIIKRTEKLSGGSPVSHNRVGTDVWRIFCQLQDEMKKEAHSYRWPHRPTHRYGGDCSVPSHRREPFRWQHEHRSYPNRDRQRSLFDRWPEELDENIVVYFFHWSELICTCLEAFRMYFAFALIGILIFDVDLSFGMNPRCLAIWMTHFDHAWFV